MAQIKAEFNHKAVLINMPS